MGFDQDDWRRLLSVFMKTDDRETLRRAGITAFLALVGAGIGLLSSAVHLLAGDSGRALFTGLYWVPLLFAMALMRWTGKPAYAAHFSAVLVSLGLVLSPFFSSTSIPVVLGMIVVPIGATLAAGSVAGILWTVAATGLLLAGALTLPLEGAARTLAWNATIICGCMGVAVA
ncbi:MAG: hypothetical protein CL908_22735 [Deltaproteobacteria bacterium]|nr:hypothetical protein [Deltaproteobacteria bacterium]